MQFAILSTLAVVAAALGAPGDIPFDYGTKQIKNIDAACASFNKAISDWSGSYLGALSIIKQSTSVVKVIVGAATPPTGLLAKPDNSDASQLAMIDASKKLATEVGKTVDSAIAAKPKLDKIPVLGNAAAVKVFQSILVAAKTLCGVYVDNAFPDKKDQAQQICTDIQNQLMRGIAAYQ